MIHIEGMGVLGSFLAWELHNRQVPFTWYDNLARANAWSACTRAFAEDAKQDRVFEELLFWVVTRSLRCFY